MPTNRVLLYHDAVTGTTVPILAVDQGDGTYRIGQDTSITVANLTIGDVHVMNATDATKAKVVAGNTIAAGDNALAVHDANPNKIVDGAGTNILAVDANQLAARVTARPLDIGALGSYAVNVPSGTMAAGLAAAAPVFSFRWGAANTVALVRNVAVAMMSLGIGFTAGYALLELMIARAFTGSDSAGTPVVLTGNNAKKRTSFATSALTDMRISNTVTLTAGTRTLDANAFAAIMFGIDATINKVFLPTTSIAAPNVASGVWPIVLAQNEGFIVRATVPATGTWQLQVACEWDELSAF